MILSHNISFFNQNNNIMEVYKSKYLVLNYYEIDNYIEMIWLPETFYMNAEDYKKEFRKYVEIITQYKPKAVLPDTIDMKFTISPKLQEWTNKHIFTFSLSIGLDKAAFVVSEDFISQLSIEQTMDENEGKKFKTKYFTNKEDARNWILTQLTPPKPSSK